MSESPSLGALQVPHVQEHVTLNVLSTKFKLIAFKKADIDTIGVCLLKLLLADHPERLVLVSLCNTKVLVHHYDSQLDIFGY